MGARTKYRGQNLFALYNVNDNYRAEELNDHSFLQREALLRSSGNLTSIGRRPLFYNLAATRRQYADSDKLEENEIKFHLATGIKRFQLSHNIHFRDRQTSLGRDEVIQGTQLVRTQIGTVSIGSALNYELGPAQLWSAAASVNWFRTERVQVSARASHFLQPNFGNDNVGADLTVFFDKCSLGVNFNYFETGGPALGITIGTSLTRDNRSSNWTVQHQRMASRAVASVRAFIDLNGNKIFDEGDEPLSGVGFLNLTAWRKVRTNRDGIALLTGLQVNRAQTIELNSSTVDDPFLVPLSKGVNVLGHPGSFVDVEFPFSYMGEMEGMVVEAGNAEVPIRHVGLEILDRQGNRVQSTVAEFDGYYYFSNLLPGEYRLAVIASTVNPTRYEVQAPVPFAVPPQGGFIPGPDIALIRKEEVAPPPVIAARIEPVVIEPVVVEPALVQPAEPSTTPSPLATSLTPVVMAAAVQDSANIGQTALAQEPSFNEEQTLSLIFEMLYRNSLWPDKPVP